MTSSGLRLLVKFRLRLFSWFPSLIESRPRMRAGFLCRNTSGLRTSCGIVTPMERRSIWVTFSCRPFEAARSNSVCQGFVSLPAGRWQIA